MDFKAGHLGALHPLQVIALQVVESKQSISRYHLLTIIYQWSKEFPGGTGPRCDRYLDALERQAWLTSEERIEKTWTGGFTKVQYYTIHPSKIGMVQP